MANQFRWKSNKRRSAAQRAHVKTLNLRKQNAPPSTTTELPLVSSPPENHLPDDTLEGQEEAPRDVQTDRKREHLGWNPAKRRSAAQKAHIQSLHLRQRNSLSSTPGLAPLPSSPKDHPSPDPLEGQAKEPCEAPARVVLSLVGPQSSQVALLRHEVNSLPSEPIVNTAEGLTTVQNRSHIPEPSADGACAPNPHPPIHASPLSL